MTLDYGTFRNKTVATFPKQRDVLAAWGFLVTGGGYNEHIYVESWQEKKEVVVLNETFLQTLCGRAQM